MPEFDPNTEIILSRLSKEILGGHQVADIFNNPKEFPTHLIEKLALETAWKYWVGQINYQQGDCIISNMYAFWIADEHYFNNYTFSDTAWECYEAFDAGIFSRGR